MRYLKYIFLFSICLFLGQGLYATNPELPKKKTSIKQRLAKVFGFGKKTKKINLAPPMQAQRSAIKTGQQKEALNKMASKIPAKQRAALFAKDRQQKYAIQNQQKAHAIARAKAVASAKSQVQKNNALKKTKNAGTPPAVQPRSTAKTSAAPSAGNAGPVVRAKQPIKGQMHGQIPPNPNVQKSAGSPPAVQPRSTAKSSVAPSAGKAGPVISAKPLPPGQQHSKVPSKSGVVYGKLPGERKQVQKNTSGNIKQQLRDKVGTSVPSPSRSTAKAPPPPSASKAGPVIRAQQPIKGQMHGKLPPQRNAGSPPPVPPRSTAKTPAPPSAGKAGSVVRAKPLPPGQQHSKVPSKSGVIYSTLPGKNNQQGKQKNTKDNIKQQLKDKVKTLDAKQNKQKSAKQKAAKRGRGGKG